MAKPKALVFVESLEMQKFLAYFLKTKFDMEKMPMRINGSIKRVKRQEYVNEFQLHNNVGFDVMLISPRAGGVGLNLTAANHVIHLSRCWNPAIEDQCTDRAYRIGQTKPVKVHIPMAVHPDPVLGPNSLDLKLDELLNRKRNMNLDVLQCTEDGTEARGLVDGVCGVAIESDPRTNISLGYIDRLEPVSGFVNWVHELAKLMVGL